MKITKTQLKQIIKEEMSTVLENKSTLAMIKKPSPDLEDLIYDSLGAAEEAIIKALRLYKGQTYRIFDKLLMEDSEEGLEDLKSRMADWRDEEDINKVRQLFANREKGLAKLNALYQAISNEKL